MKAKKSDPARSEGARYERAATRAYLRRRVTAADGLNNDEAATAYTIALNWVLARESRYQKKSGGL